MNNIDNIFNKYKISPIAIILPIAFLLKVLTFMGLSEGDDLFYSQLAYEASLGQISAYYIFCLRWAVFMPVALLYEIFGVNEITSIAPTMVYGIISVWLVYKIVEKETSYHIAAMTTILYATFPVVLVFGNFLQTDPCLEFFTLLTIYFFQVGVSSDKKRFFILAGFFLGGMVITRITGYFIAPMLMLYLFWKKGVNFRSLSALALTAVFSLVIFEIQGAVFYFQHNNFFHYFVISKNAVAIQNAMTDVDPKDLFFYVRTLFVDKDFANWRFFGFNGITFYGLIVFFLVRSFKYKPGKELVFLLWYVLYFLFMTFIPTSIKPLTFLIRNIRYTIVFTAPMCAFIAMIIYQTGSINKYLKYLMTSFFLFIVFSNIYYSFETSRIFKNKRDNQKESLAFIFEKYPDAKIYLADRNIEKRIDYYSGYKNHNYTGISSLRQITEPGLFLMLRPGGYSKSRFNIPKKELEKIIKKPPKGLKLIKKLPYFIVYKADPVQ
ncbi:MAG TPA: glycosyltransferase family 39 protein [bacterium]|nr:glycosyltransferase family 39 protein [bacterium]HPS28990.1 glycosyltransferase family 39 protein [bacterium]